MQIKNLECEYTACYNKTMPKTEADSILHICIKIEKITREKEREYYAKTNRY